MGQGIQDFLQGLPVNNEKESTSPSEKLSWKSSEVELQKASMMLSKQCFLHLRTGHGTTTWRFASDEFPFHFGVIFFGGSMLVFQGGVEYNGHPWDWNIYLHEWLILWYSGGQSQVNIPYMDAMGNGFAFKSQT